MNVLSYTDLSIIGQVRRVSNGKSYVIFKSGNYEVMVMHRNTKSGSIIQINDNAYPGERLIFNAEQYSFMVGYIKQQMNIYGNGEGNYRVINW